MGKKLKDLYHEKDHILDQIGRLGVFRQGSLSPRYRKCGRPYCHCAQEGSKGHGPVWFVTRSVRGKTNTKTIPADRLDETFTQIERFHTYQDLVHQYTEVNIQICDALLEESEEVSLEAKKGG